MSSANPTAGNAAFGICGMLNVNMGVVVAGDSFTLDYDIIATVFGDPFNGPQFAGGTGPNAANVNTFRVTNSPATVPEPGSIALMGLALVGLAATRRKNSQRHG